MPATDDAIPRLYSFRRCPYAMRARVALAYSGIQVELREVLLRDKPEAMLALSPKGTVPVLELPDGEVIDESLDVMCWALAQSDPDGWLDVSGWQALVNDNDGPFKQALDRYKYHSRHPERPREAYRADGERFLAILEQALERHGGKGLLRDSLSIADMAIFPFIRQFANTDYDWFEAAPYPRLREWLEQRVNSPLFRAVMTKRSPWQAGDEEIRETWPTPA